jgi:Rrf2 family iron-sulfur cluster assembly transcriptional regulator
MLDLAIHGIEGPVALADISARQGISQSYLEQLFARLRQEGLVQSIRGPGGGYRLRRAPGEIPVADVVQAVDERFDATRCEGKHDCQEGHVCLTHLLWQDLSRRIYEFLNTVTLGSLMEQRAVQETAKRQDLLRFHQRQTVGDTQAGAALMP